MTLAEISIKRPIFITCLITIMIALGLLSMRKLGIDLFPDVTFPVVMVSTPYLGAGPAEIETLVSKPLEDEISTLSGLKRLTSVNQEGVSIVVAEFTLETDVKYAEQQIRDRVSSTKRRLPPDVKEPVIRRIDPSDQPIVILSVKGDLPVDRLVDLADEQIRPRIEQVNQVGLVEVIGGRKREIHVSLDRKKLKAHEISASQVVARLAATGENVPVGKTSEGAKETVYRTVGQFKSFHEIGQTIVNFFGSDIPTTLNDIGHVEDALTDERSRTYVNGERSLFLYIFRQSGANTIAVADGVRKKVELINTELSQAPGKPHIEVVRDMSYWIRINVDDVKESIMIGVVLAVLVVFLFLANGRSTIITGLALPNSLIGAFVLMALAGFSINIMTLLALSLAVGLLVDDAIVVRENIFRHLEAGESPAQAAKNGTQEVKLAVIATTMTVIAVFGPIAFLKGVVGQFFKQFGATICFAMAISLFDALTVAPMLSAYFAGKVHDTRKGLWYYTIGAPLRLFVKFQDGLEFIYEKALRFTVRWPAVVLILAGVIFFASLSTLKRIPKTFLPPQEAGEFSVGLDLPPGTSLDAMDSLAKEVDQLIRANTEVSESVLTVGGREGEPNVAEFYVQLVPPKARKVTTVELKERVRQQLAKFSFANPKVKDYDAIGGGMRPFALNILGEDTKELERIATAMTQRLKDHPALKDVDINYRPGKPELQVVPNLKKMEGLGITSVTIGQELRAQIEGIVAAKYREHGIEYDVRVRVKEDQRDLKSEFDQIFVPNINFNLIRLADVAKAVATEGPAKIFRQDRGRYIQINADMAPGGGMGEVMSDIQRMFKEDPEVKLPPGIRYAFIGQAENFAELIENMVLAVGFGCLFIFLVLASLYESFVTPFTIMLALPLAMCGSFVALFLAHQSLNIFAMIGGIMLLGVATKNSILLVDYTLQLMGRGLSRSDALIKAGKTRLRPILMTTMALIAGTLPVALGLNEASRQRVSMGIAIVGGLISSTLLTLVVVPAAFAYVDRFRVWGGYWLGRLFGVNVKAEQDLVSGNGGADTPNVVPERGLTQSGLKRPEQAEERPQ